MSPSLRAEVVAVQPEQGAVDLRHPRINDKIGPGTTSFLLNSMDIGKLRPGMTVRVQIFWCSQAETEGPLAGRWIENLEIVTGRPSAVVDLEPLVRDAHERCAAVITLMRLSHPFEQLHYMPCAQQRMLDLVATRISAAPVGKRS